MLILVISDTHISPANDSLKYWKNLGKYCVKYKPEYIVHLGDVADFDSQNWLKSSRGLYTLQEEMNSVADHLLAFETELSKYRRHCQDIKHKMYRPKKVLCLGNHDIRNDVSGSLENLFCGYGWDVLDYQMPFHCDGITFAHCLPRGLSDTPCTTAQELLENYHSSVICGHSHCRDYAESFRIEDGKKIFAIKCPMFSNSAPGWARCLSDKWSRGFTIIDTDSGEFIWKDLESLNV